MLRQIMYHKKKTCSEVRWKMWGYFRIAIYTNSFQSLTETDYDTMIVKIKLQNITKQHVKVSQTFVN